MRQFFKFLFASCLGFVLASVLISLISVMILAGIASSSSKPEKIKPNSVLELSLDQPIPELTNNLERDPFQLESDDVVGLHDMVTAIKHAKTDKNIKGIVIHPENMIGQGFATLASLREALQDFKSSGKFIISYASYFTQGSYYLASTSDKIYLHPMGNVDFRGFAVVIPFFKEMLDKIGVKFQAFYAGDFKSATEPYRRTEMSEENRLQLREFIDEIYDLYLDEISESRNTNNQRLDSISDEFLMRKAEDAVNMGFVDAVGYRDEVLKDIRERLGLEEKDKIQTVSVSTYYTHAKKKSDLSVKDKIAVVFAEGSIVGGNAAQPGQVNDKEFVKIIEKLRKDEKVKGIVLRVNSPGGSGLASENIWRELKLAKDQGKKIMVSMGNYAASGGYYIACAADSVLAQNETLTGSIGVFSLFPDITQLMSQKLGIRFDTVKTGPYAAGFNPTIGLSEGEGNYMQEGVDRMYEQFLMRVAEARGMTRDEVHAVAQGRIWSGRKATELGLVDRIGTMDEAIESAAKLAGLEKYRIITFPKPKEPLQQLLDELTGKKDDITTRVLSRELGEYGKLLQQVKEVKEAEGIQFRLPFLIQMQ